MAEIRRVNTKEEYKTIVLRNAIKVEDIIKLHEAGELHGSEYLFRLNDVQEITQFVAKGFWCMALERFKLLTKHRIDNGTKICNKIIRDAWE